MRLTTDRNPRSSPDAGAAGPGLALFMNRRIHRNAPRPAAIGLAIVFAALALATSGCGGGGESNPEAASAASKASLGITTQTPTEGQQVSGSITWQVAVTGATPSRVDFAIDGTVRWTQTTSPYLYGGKTGSLDTAQLSNGSHTLSATAYGSKGLKPATTRVSVTVANTAPPPSGERVYWGAWIGNQLTGTAPPWDMTAVAKFEQMTGKPLSLLQFASPFANCSTSPCSYYAFPSTPFNNIRAHGAIPFLSWSSQSTPSSTSEPNFQLSDVVNGTYDSYIRAFATKAREWGHPFFLRFDWEMNGNWFPWAERANGNAAGEYVAAWRHVHDIFSSAGATNVSWVWCPYVDPNGTLQSLGSLYPGGSYVDWTCLDGYNWGTNPNSPRGWRSFEFLFKPSYREITETIAPGKPFLVGETASTEYGGSKAGWIHNMFSALPTEFPKIRGLLWFEKNDNGMDWPLESSETASSSFANGIQDPRYVPNNFGSLSTSPIPPP
jgi:mannan endo-1,4-beta-mannosidase